VFTLSDITRIVSGRRLESVDHPVLGVTHDSRAVDPGDLFIALRGRRTDGHRYLKQAYRRGAVGALVSDPRAIPKGAINVVVVKDTLAALQQLGRAWRRKLDARFIAITGSNGKTTTKELVAHLLAETYDVFTAPGNYNTEIGTPLALLAMPEHAEVGVFEMGAEAPGDIRFLADLLTPDTALVTGVGPSHLEGFGTVRAVASEKWSLVRSLAGDRIAFVNADSAELRTLLSHGPASCVSVGMEHGTFRGRLVQSVPRLVVETKEPSLILDTPLLGRHNATNVLLAAAAAVHFHVPAETIASRIRNAPIPPHRLERIRTSFGWILDDTYNANPASGAAALEVLASLGSPADRRVFVFGDMLGLGDRSGAEHRKILDAAIQAEIDVVLPVGDRATGACRNVSHPSIVFCERDDVPRAIRTMAADRSTVVLIKGSHDLDMESIVAALQKPVEP